MQNYGLFNKLLSYTYERTLFSGCLADKVKRYVVTGCKQMANNWDTRKSFQGRSKALKFVENDDVALLKRVTAMW